MKDAYGRPIRSAEKLAYLTFNQDGRLIEASNRFAIGMAGNARLR